MHQQEKKKQGPKEGDGGEEREERETSCFHFFFCLTCPTLEDFLLLGFDDLEETFQSLSFS
jgi:hypothetical protein